MSRFNVRKVAVLGAGVMGAQIAAHLVNVRVPVVLEGGKTEPRFFSQLKVEPTAFGMTHGVTQLAATEEESASRWKTPRSSAMPLPIPRAVLSMTSTPFMPDRRSETTMTFSGPQSSICARRSVMFINDASAKWTSEVLERPKC